MKKNKLERNIIRNLISISDEKRVPFIDVIRTYVKYVEEDSVGEIPDVLYFDKEALEKTKQYYLK